MSGEPVRGRGEPIRTTRHLPAEDVDYDEESDEVRIVVTQDAAGPVETDDVPFTEWAERACASAAADEVLLRIEARAEDQAEGIGASAGFADEPAVTVTYTIWLEEWGDAVSTRPSHDFDTIVELAPRSVTVEVELDGRERRCELPVFVERRRGQLL